MEVNVFRNGEGRWMSVLTPVCVFPNMDDEGRVVGWERREYNDVVTLDAEACEYSLSLWLVMGAWSIMARYWFISAVWSSVS